MANEQQRSTSQSTGDLTNEQKRSVVLSNGWQTLWSDDFWVRREALIANNVQGFSLDDAFHQVITLQMHAVLANKEKRFR